MQWSAVGPAMDNYYSVGLYNDLYVTIIGPGIPELLMVSQDTLISNELRV